MSQSSIIGKAVNEPKQAKKPQFVTNTLPRKEIAETKIRGYKIFESEGEFIVIEAATVAEAIKRSGIEKPVKIIMLGSDIKNILTEAKSGKDNDKIPLNPLDTLQNPQ